MGGSSACSLARVLCVRYRRIHRVHERRCSINISARVPYIIRFNHSFCWVVAFWIVQLGCSAVCGCPAVYMPVDTPASFRYVDPERRFENGSSSLHSVFCSKSLYCNTDSMHFERHSVLILSRWFFDCFDASVFRYW